MDDQERVRGAGMNFWKSSVSGSAPITREMLELAKAKMDEEWERGWIDAWEEAHDD
mgnify:CR=1 FL=1